MKTTSNISTALLCICACSNTYAAKSVEDNNKTVFKKRPNVILINTDDLAWGDLSCYGGKLIKTPNIDRLSAEGIRFTDAYVSAPVSGASRTGLLTGVHQQRYGIQWNHDLWSIPGRKGETVIQKNDKQIQSAFKDAGYITAMAGKIGIINDQPFDYKFSYAYNGVNYFPDENGYYAGTEAENGDNKSKINRNNMWGPERKGDEYLTDRCGRQCIEFIENNKDKDKPFFFYLSFNAPHSPFHAKKTDRNRVNHIKSEMAKLYAAMVLAVDDNIGKILDYLDKENLRDNTIIVFLSDNGPANPIHLRIPSYWDKNSPYHVMGQRGGLNGYKGTMWEAGIRVPYIISWKGELPEGETYSHPVSTLDIYPTLCSATHIKIPENKKLDGTDLMPYLMGGNYNAPHKFLFWYANRMGAVRMDNWKMLIEDDKHYLFNLADDMGETKNVMRQNPDIMRKMLEAYFEFRNEMPAYRNPYLRPIDIPDSAVVGLPVLDPK